MDKREYLKSMLSNMLDDKHEQATLDLHNYLTDKMREVAGIASSQNGDSGNADVGNDDFSAD